MIYTSYFSRFKQVPNPISIANSMPKYCIPTVKKLPELAPIWSKVCYLKSNKITRLEFEDIYISTLKIRNITHDWIMENINDESTLLCWEFPDEFCHRHILRGYLNSIGIRCEEYPILIEK